MTIHPQQGGAGAIGAVVAAGGGAGGEPLQQQSQQQHVVIGDTTDGLTVTTSTPTAAGAVPKKTSTAKLSQLDHKHSSDSGQRLVDYFVVISSVEQKRKLNNNNHPNEDPTKDDGWKKKDPTTTSPNNDNSTSTFSTDWKTESANIDEEDIFRDYSFGPKITARYPLRDYPDNPLHENVCFFCHPGGSIMIRTQEIMPKVHYFVATGGTGRQVYGTCLTLWEPYKVMMPTPATTTTSSSTTTTPTMSMQQVYVQNNKPVFLPKCLVILSRYPYLAAFREFLTQLNRLSKLGEMYLPIERYIVNFCSEIPAPPPGSFEVQTTILDSVIRIWSPPHNQPIAYVSLPFGQLFECLDIDNIILVWHCLVLERQVLITSTQLSLLTVASEIFLALLFPMRWSHAYIPLLPHFLIPILSAPMPFLCGINKTNLVDALYDLSGDCVLVDLDKNTVTLGPDTQPLPPFPPVQEATLRAQLQDNVGWVFREARCLTRNDDYSENGQNLQPHVKVMAEAMWESKLCLFDEAFHLMFTPDQARKNLLNGNDGSGIEITDRDITSSVLHGGSNSGNSNTTTSGSNIRYQSEWDAVQEAFLDTYVYLLRNYRKFLVFPSKHNEGSYGGAGFRTKDFIDSQRYDMREFLEQMTSTQMFDNFITKRLYGSGEADVAFFDLAVDRFLKTAGMFADVDLTGRLLDKSGITASATDNKRGGLGSSLTGSFGSTGSATNSAANAILKFRAMSAPVTKKTMPLLQSSRVHTKLKTIVPPEPTGDGLVMENMQILSQQDDLSTTSLDADDDNLSVQSSGTNDSGPKVVRSPRMKRSSTIQAKAAEILHRKKKQQFFKYDEFPSTFDPNLFGTPRPLPAAVIAEFDRQRKDAAQFRRRSSAPKGTNKHIHHAHAVDPSVPPNPQAATFTVFVMAFSAMVGKELLDMAHSPRHGEERTILASYVPVRDDDSATGRTASDETSTISGGGDDDEDEEEDVVDAKEKAGVAKMKTSRPNIRGVLADDDDDEDPDGDFQDAKSTTDEDGFLTSSDGESADPPRTTSNAKSSSTSRTKQAQQPRKKRFADKLSDLEIEEAKATGRGQLGLAFEMLTMVKKRGLKADPEAYQCLIDACGRVGDTKRATDLLGKMHEDGIVADGTVYACLVSAFSADSAWKDGKKNEELPEWANSTAVEMDWNKLQRKTVFQRLVSPLMDTDDDDDQSNDEEGGGNTSYYQKLRRKYMAARRKNQAASRVTSPEKGSSNADDNGMALFVTEAVERQVSLGENLLEIVFPDISIDTEDENCPRCNYMLTDDDVVTGWRPDSNDYTTSCPNCTQRFVPHFCVQCSAASFVGSKGPASPLMCERLSPWVLQKEIRLVMSDTDGIDNLLSPTWRSEEYKNSVLWWNLVLSCMRYRFPFTFLLQGSFEQNLIAPILDEDS